MRAAKTRLKVWAPHEGPRDARRAEASLAPVAAALGAGLGVLGASGLAMLTERLAADGESAFALVPLLVIGLVIGARTGWHLGVYWWRSTLPTQ